MKILIIFLFVVILSHTMYAQDINDPTPYFDHLQLPSSMFLRNTNEFIKCWNYGSISRRFDNVIKMNYTLHGEVPETWNNFFSYRYGDSTRLYMNLSTDSIPVAANSNSYSLTQASAFLYDPFIDLSGLYSDSINNFKKITNDASGSVFGFLSRNSIFLNAQTTGSRDFVMSKAMLTSYGKDTAMVLHDPWVNNYMVFAS